MGINEAFLSFLWQFRLFSRNLLQCAGGEGLRIIHPGWLNTHAGPDFMQATLEIAGTRWVGNVEIHVRASDWFCIRMNKINIMTRWSFMWSMNMTPMFTGVTER